MYTLIYNENGQEVKEEYYTRQEADYYKRRHFKSKVVTSYEVTDIEKGLCQDTYRCIAESPIKAVQQYIKENDLNIKVKVDLTNTGRFVVRSNNTSKVYKEV
jgi:hypothetical protein